MKRRFASGELTLDGFENEMEGVYSSTINESTYHESSHTYKPFEMTKEYLEKTVTIVDIAKPKYNSKGSD